MTEGTPRLYAAIAYAGEATVGEDVTLGSDAVAGLAFRKVNVKEAFTFVDARGRYFRAALTACDASRAEAQVYEAMALSPESPARITLVCAVLARQRMLLVAQKAAELGVARVQPVFTTRSVQPRDIAHEKVHAWPGQAIKGARQCRRATVPEVLPAVPLGGVLGSVAWTRAAMRLYLDDRAEVSAGEALAQGPAVREVMFAVGPEGGWTDAERLALGAAGASALRLGGRVLRAETAVFAGLAVLQHRVGDMGA